VGYPYGQKGWKLYDLEKHKIFMSRDVVFYEHVYSYSLLMHENPNGNIATSTPESNRESGTDPAHLKPSRLQIIGSQQSTCVPILALTEPPGPHIYRNGAGREGEHRPCNTSKRAGLGNNPKPTLA